MHFYLSNVCFFWCLKCTLTNMIKMTKKWFLIFFLLKEKETKKRNFQSFRNIFFGCRAVTFTYSLERAKPLTQHMLLPCCIPGSFATNFHYIIRETSAKHTIKVILFSRKCWIQCFVSSWLADFCLLSFLYLKIVSLGTGKAALKNSHSGWKRYCEIIY